MAAMSDLMSKSSFAKMAGVSAPAISQAIRAGIIVTAKDEAGNERIEADHPVNKAYINNARGHRDKSERQRESANANHQGRVPEHKKAPSRREKLVDMLVTKLDEKFESENQGVILPSKIEMEIRRLIQQEEKDRIANEVAKKNLIPREVFSRRIDSMISVLNNHFLPYPRRMTPQICGALGISDPEQQLKVEEMLNKEMQRALEEFKREAKSE